MTFKHLLLVLCVLSARSAFGVMPSGAYVFVTCSNIVEVKLNTCGASSGDTPGGSYYHFYPGQTYDVVTMFNSYNGRNEASAATCVKVFPRYTGTYGPAFTVSTNQTKGFSTCYPVPDFSSNWYTATLRIENLDSVGHTFMAYTNQGLYSTKYLQPGAGWTIEYGGTSYVDLWATEDPLLGFEGTPTIYHANYATNAASVVPGYVYTGPPVTPIYQGGLSNIVGNTDVGSAAIYDAITKLGVQVHSDISGLDFSPQVSVSVSNNIEGGLTEERWSALTNLLGRSGAGPDTNAQYGSGEAAGAEGRSKLESAGGLFGAPVVESPGSSLTWSVAAGGWTIELDPFEHPWVNALASLCRHVIAWGSLVGLIYFCSQEVSKGVGVSGTWRQASSAGTSVAGTNVNSASAISMAGLITVALAVLPATALTVMTTFSGGWAAGPVPSISNGSIAWSVDAMLQFIPLGLVVSDLATGLIFRFTWSGLLWFVQTVIRFLVG